MNKIIYPLTNHSHQVNKNTPDAESIWSIFVRYRIQVSIFGHTQIRLQHIYFLSGVLK